MFDFDNFLLTHNYSKEIVKDAFGKIMFINYQKEVIEGGYNCITVFSDKRVSFCKPFSDLIHYKSEIPKNETEAKEILTKIEY